MNSQTGKQPAQAVRKFVVLASRSLPKGYFILGVERLYFIGRGAGCQVQVFGDEISRKHARIEGEAPNYSITDLGSTNGTLVNDHPLTPNTPRRLNPGDKITVGPHHMHFTIVEGTREDVAARYDGADTDTKKMQTIARGKTATLAG